MPNESWQQAGVNGPQKVVLWLSRRVPESSRGLIGPKAASLCTLQRLGLRVPPCFFVTTTAFREHLDGGGLRSRIDAQSDETHSALEQIRGMILQEPLAASLREQIAVAYARLGASVVAVRSSATAEDLPNHSFAGQYETILGVKSLEECFDAIKKCWASLWTERAFEYRRHNGIDHRQVEMAVIVQELVPATASGVLFTADPVSGRTDRIAIDACLGLGDALVSGRTVADHFVVAKRALNIVTHDTTQQTPVIDRATIRKLARLAQRVECGFGCPQDIEWAIAGSDIFLLQSRSITTLGEEKPQRDRYIWCSFPAKEVIPDVVTPATRSIIDAFAGVMFDPFLRMMGVDRVGVPLHGYQAGRVYFNASFWAAVIRRLTGSKQVDFAQDVGSNPALVKMIEMFEQATDDSLPLIKASRLRLLLRIPVLIPSYLRCTPGRGRHILAGTRAENERYGRFAVSGMSADELIGGCQEIGAAFRNALHSFGYLLGTIAAYPVLRWACGKWLSDTALAGRLLAGMGNMDDAQAALDLWTLAVEADRQPEVRTALLAGDEWRDVQADLSGRAGAEAFLSGWREFMTRHGHHCRAEIELANPRWSETPDYVLGLVRGYLACLDKASPLENRERIRCERQDLERQCRRKLRNPLKGMIFNHLLVRSQNGAVFRENIKSDVVRLLAAMRRLLIELGARLCAAGVLADAGDVFFLRLEELDPVARGAAEVDVRRLIAERRAEYDKWSLMTPPELIVGQFDPETYVPEGIDTDTETLAGLAVSPGVATGKARVILRTDSHTRLEVGEILVAPFTDPGWTPYFMPAAGIVMNQGSLLSHGSIIARELGIPAVTNVGHATEIIKTGQMLRVDGDRGTVTLLDGQ